MTNRKATLSLDRDFTVDLPILEGTRGQDVIDISSLGTAPSIIRTRRTN